MPASFIITPQGLTSLVLLLMTVVFFVFLVRQRPYTPAMRWLLCHEASLILFLTCQLLLYAAIWPFLYPLTYLSFVTGMACLLQFSFTFPQPAPATRAKRGLGVLSGLSIALEVVFALRYWAAPLNENAWLVHVVGIGIGLSLILAALVALVYQVARLDEARSLARALLAPRTAGARAARNMLLVSLAIGSLAIGALVYRLWLQSVLPEVFFAVAWNVGLMLWLALFDLTYLTNTPSRVSFQIKLALGTLVAVLVSVWLLSLFYPSQLQVVNDRQQMVDVKITQAELAQPSLLAAKSLPQAVVFVVECPSPRTTRPVVLMTRGLQVDVPRVCSDDYRPDDMYRQSGLDTPVFLNRFFQGQRLYLIGFSRPAYFRAMNELTQPIALVMVGSSLFITLFLPLFFYSNLNRPLNALLDGFQQVNQGRLDVSVPVLTNDEIGWLAHSFNTMAAELRASVAGLENQITLARQAERALREQQEQLRAFSARLGEVEEAERKKLGRELHDQAGQNLTALSLTLKLIRTQLPASAQNPATLEQVAARLDDASELVRQTTQRIRNVMEDLQPPALEEFGLPAALSWYATHFSERTGIVVEVSAPAASPRPTPQVEIALFRIAQEALTNIARHAQATRAEVHIAFTPTGTRMCIQDNGLGFDDRQPHDTHRTHWGLRIMAERAISIGGVCRVESAPSQGTKVLVEVQS